MPWMGGGVGTHFAVNGSGVGVGTGVGAGAGGSVAMGEFGDDELEPQPERKMPRRVTKTQYLIFIDIYLRLYQSFFISAHKTTYSCREFTLLDLKIQGFLVSKDGRTGGGRAWPLLDRGADRPAHQVAKVI